ncbi:MAG TPA: glutamate synthase large subunit, partial [Acetobacteraceae bacterium]|nr:glutamate synthase large subunit [Acetobacteraceae bacterium]
MTEPIESPTQFLAAWQANTAALHQTYSPAQEHDSCGVGFIAALNGKRRRDVVESAIAALRAVWHRGAVDADGKTGDGAGIHLEIPQDFFAAAVARSGCAVMPGPIAVGMIFLPKTDLNAQERCRQIVETEILNFGYRIYGWRQVPIDVACIGEKANATRPEIEQIMLWNAKSAPEADFERDLYIIRRRIE